MANPRVSVTLSESQYETLRRLARLQARSMSAIISDFLEVVEPGLKRVVEFGEAAEEANEEQLEVLRKAVERIDADLHEPLMASLGQAHQAFARTDAVVVDFKRAREKADPRPVITGVNPDGQAPDQR